MASRIGEGDISSIPRVPESRDSSRLEENIAPELENFMRLRSYIQHMQQGSSLLLWRHDGLQLCWFWLDESCSTLYWDLDEGSGEGDVAEGEGGSLGLESIDDIIPLGAGPDQLSDSPTDSSFSVLVGDERLDIVAPTSFDFQVWYFGLAFATRMRLNAMRDALGETWIDSGTDDQNEPGESEMNTSGRRGRRGNDTNAHNAFIVGDGDSDVGEAALVHRMEEQRRRIENLQRENAALREGQRSKDEAISRLLKAIKTSEEARGEAEAKTNATTQESERHWHQRELYTARGRNRKMQDMLQVKDACISELLELLTLAVQGNAPE